MSHSEKFEKTVQFARTVCGMAGGDGIAKDYKVSWKTMVTFTVVNVGIFLTLYTAYIESVNLGDYSSIFKGFSILGSAIQGYSKLVNVIITCDNFRYLYLQYKNIYETYEVKSTAFQKCLKDADSLMKKFVLYTFAFLVVIITSVLAVPIVHWFVYNTRSELLPFELPFIDKETDIGRYITLGTQVICMIFAVMGNFGSDAFLFIFVTHIPMMKDILKCKFNELDEALEADSDTDATSSELLKDIFKFHQLYNNLTNVVRDTFFWVIFIQIATEFGGIACCIVTTFLGTWPTAPVVTIYLFSMIYLYCGMGNLVDSANDEITLMIYDCCWYKLSVLDQKSLLIMLRDSQRATGMSIGGIAPLTLNTALQLTKTIYTFSMVLQESFA